MKKIPSVREQLSQINGDLIRCAELVRENGGYVAMGPDLADRLALTIDTLAKSWDTVREAYDREHEALLEARRVPWRLYKALLLLGVGWLLGHYW